MITSTDVSGDGAQAARIESLERLRADNTKQSAETKKEMMEEIRANLAAAESKLAAKEEELDRSRAEVAELRVMLRASSSHNTSGRL